MKPLVAFGGVFLQADDPSALGVWYRRHFNLDFVRTGAMHFCSPAPLQEMTSTGYNVFSIFPRGDNYFKGSSLVLNFVVADLQAVIAKLRSEGVAVEDRIEEGEFGKFAWLTDPAGNRIELWQPPAK